MREALTFQLHRRRRIPSPNSHSSKGVRAWIKEICDLLNTNPSQLARAAGLSASTINRFMASTDQRKNISAHTIDVLVETAAKLYDESSLISPQRGDRDNALAMLRRVEFDVIGEAVAGKFVSKYQWDPQSTYRVNLPIPADYYFSDVMFGIELKDQHAASAYPKGSIIVAASMSPPIRGGDHIVVLITSDSRTVEVTLRELVESPSGDKWLISLEKSPRTIPDLLFSRAGSGDFAPGVALAGRVIASIQYPENALRLAESLNTAV